MWLFDKEADARYQVDDGTVSSSSSIFMIPAENCNEEGVLVVPVVALDILVALNTDDGAWVVVSVIIRLTVFIDDCLY